MLPLLASDNPFEHTWNTWEIHFYGHMLDLHAIPVCRQLGITNFVASGKPGSCKITRASEAPATCTLTNEKPRIIRRTTK